MSAEISCEKGTANMKKIETVTMIGLGAVGGGVLAKIAETVPMGNIRVVASGARAERLRQDGIEVNGRKYKFNVYEPADTPGPADLLLIVVKNNQLGEAIAAVRNHVGPDTVILSLLNGVTSEQEVAAAYGAEKVLHSLMLGTDATRVGNRTEYASLGIIPFGEARNEAGAYAENVLRVQEFFTRTGVNHEIPADMIRTMWKKFMLNVGLNQTSAVVRCTYSVMQHEGPARDLVRSAMQEALAIVEREGIDLSAADLQEGLEVLDRLGPKGKTSMLQDVEAKSRTEVEMFGGTVVALGKKHGLPTPVNEVLYRAIKAMEETF